MSGAQSESSTATGARKIIIVYNAALTVIVTALFTCSIRLFGLQTTRLNKYYYSTTRSTTTTIIIIIIRPITVAAAFRVRTNKRTPARCMIE